MKKWLQIFLWVILFPGIGWCQERREPGQDGNPSQGGTTAVQSEIMVPSKIRSFTLDNQYSLQVPQVVDTATLYFHIYSPMFQKGISNTYLGYLGAPYISNDFFERINYPDYYFLSSFKAYTKNIENTTFYNTTTPFSHLMYDQGNDEGEQVFTAFFTQNIDSVTNLGFSYDVVKGTGDFKYQSANHKNLNLFYSKNALRSNIYVSLMSATNKTAENGGIKDSIIFDVANPEDKAVKLADEMDLEVKTLSLLASYERLFGEIPFLRRNAPVDTSVSPSPAFVPRYGLQYSVNYSKYRRKLTEGVVDGSFFDTIYFNKTANRYDSSYYQRFTQILQVRMLEDTTRRFTFGKRAYVENEIIGAMHPVNDGVRKYSYSNLYLGGEIYNRSNRFLQWSAQARFAMLGRNLGDAIVKGILYKPFYLFGDTLSLMAEGWYRDISPDIFQEHWHDNHFKWNNHFTKQHEVVLKARADWAKIHFSAGANYAMMSNFLYNNKNSMPAQYNGEFSVLSVWLNKEFVWGPLRWNNKVQWQESSNNSVVHLPVLNANVSLSVTGTLFKVMKYQIGTEAYYNTEFLADKYEPSTSRFYLQNDLLTGGYPFLNAFVNAKLKRTSAFAQLMHYNSSFLGGNYFSSPFYPVKQMAFRFGFLWSFYD